MTKRYRKKKVTGMFKDLSLNRKFKDGEGESVDRGILQAKPGSGRRTLP